MPLGFFGLPRYGKKIKASCMEGLLLIVLQLQTYDSCYQISVALLLNCAVLPTGHPFLPAPATLPAVCAMSPPSGGRPQVS